MRMMMSMMPCRYFLAVVTTQSREIVGGGFLFSFFSFLSSVRRSLYLALGNSQCRVDMLCF